MILEMAMSAEMTSREHFDTAKAVAALTYLVERTDLTMYPVLKMLYLADKCHLERYGRFIVGDSYVAMERGPVPSQTYDLLKFVRGDRHYFNDGDQALEAFALDKHSNKFQLHRAADLAALSDSDVECLDEVIELCQKRGPKAIADMSHDDAWRATTVNSEMAVATIASMFDDGPVLIQHLADRHPSK